jgi:hypothetical protein
MIKPEPPDVFAGRSFVPDRLLNVAAGEGMLIFRSDELAYSEFNPVGGITPPSPATR